MWHREKRLESGGRKGLKDHQACLEILTRGDVVKSGKSPVRGRLSCGSGQGDASNTSLGKNTVLESAGLP